MGFIFCFSFFDIYRHGTLLRLRSSASQKSAKVIIKSWSDLTPLDSHSDIMMKLCW